MTTYSPTQQRVERSTPNQNLRMLESVRPLYMLPADPLVDDILIPGFSIADRVDCMVGFFSSAVLTSLAPGLASYITNSRNSFRLIINPLLQPEDLEAIENGLKSADDVVNEILEELIITEDLIQMHTLKCLSWLIKEKRIEIRVALMKDALFHPKVWLIYNGEDVIAAHGSSNVTYAGVTKNIEQIAISKSWQDSNQQYITDKFHLEFSRLWENQDENCFVISMTRKLTQQLLSLYSSESPPSEEDLNSLYASVTYSHSHNYLDEQITIPKVEFSIPKWLQFEDGEYAHQGKAVDAWCSAGCRGVLEMATGSGKTITSMISAYRLYEKTDSLLIVVAAPYVPLIEQWCDEIAEFGLKPVNLTTVSGARKRAQILQKLRRRLRNGLSSVEIVVVSYDTLCTPNFYEATRDFDCELLLIADEVHNLGRASFIENPPEFFNYRLGLSATPVRQYDEEGTNALFEFFGPIVFRFTLAEAIGSCLVEYEYFLHPVYLTVEEMDEWFELTERIRQNAWRIEIDKKDEYVLKLFRERRLLLETASGKIAMLDTLLDKEDLKTLRHTLIYTTDKNPEQLERVNRILQSRGILFRQLTSEETSNRIQTKQIVKLFQDAEIQALTAKRVLDEGVNIPQICRAYILASTTVERQWVQRRGRLLRTCRKIGKSYSIIHDFIALPPNIDEGIDSEARSLVLSELRRAQEFASLARNAGRSDGPLEFIHSLVEVVY